MLCFVTCSFMLVVKRADVFLRCVLRLRCLVAILFAFVCHKYITTVGTSTYEAEPHGPKTRIECKNGTAVRQVPSRDEHLKMAAWGRNMLWKREWTNRKQHCMLMDIREAKHDMNYVLWYHRWGRLHYNIIHECKQRQIDTNTSTFVYCAKVWAETQSEQQNNNKGDPFPYT
jgi:hypothetical protein